MLTKETVQGNLSTEFPRSDSKIPYNGCIIRDYFKKSSLYETYGMNSNIYKDLFSCLLTNARRKTKW